MFCIVFLILFFSTKYLGDYISAYWGFISQMDVINKSRTNGRKLASLNRSLHYSIYTDMYCLFFYCCCISSPFKQWLHCYFQLINIRRQIISIHTHTKFENHQEEEHNLCTHNSHLIFTTLLGKYILMLIPNGN